MAKSALEKLAQQAGKAKSVNDLNEPAANLFRLLVLIVDIRCRNRNSINGLEYNHKEE